MKSGIDKVTQGRFGAVRSLGGLLVAVLLLLVGCTTEPQYLWREIEVNGSILEVRYGDPPVFGPHKLYFYWKMEGAEPKLLGDTELDNDGANLWEENLEVVENTAERLRFWLRGEQMEDELWEVVFGEAVELRRVE